MVSEAVSHLADRLHTLWRHLPLRTLGLISAGLPMVAVVASAVLAFVGNQNRQRLETAITRHFETIVRLDSLLTLLLNAETSLRGHLLTSRPEFLEPFVTAQRSLPQELKDLHSFLAAEPGASPRAQKLARLHQIEETVDQEMNLLVQLRDERPALGTGAKDGALTDQFVRSKDLMDSLRVQLREMQGQEKELLSQRLRDIRHIRQRDYLSISLALFLGVITRAVVYWLFERRVVHRVENLSDNVRSLAGGGALPHPVTGHHDAIGKLEEEVQQAHARLDSPRPS